VYKLIFCTFIFAVLLLKYCFPTGNQLEKYCILDIFTVVYDCYLLPNGVTEQSRRHASGMTSPLACIAHTHTSLFTVIR